MGETSARASGIYDWAKTNEKNSERNVQRVVKRHGTRLDVPITKMKVQDQHVPWINPKSWFEFIMSRGLLYMMSGLCFEERHLVGSPGGSESIVTQVCSS